MKQFSLMRSLKFSLIGIATLFTMNSFAQSSSVKFELSPGDNNIKQISSISSVNAEIYPGSTPSRFILITENPYGEKVCITLKSSSGNVYRKVTWKKKLRTTFDLSHVEDDNYIVTVSSSGRNFSREVVLKTTYAAATRNLVIQ